MSIIVISGTAEANVSTIEKIFDRYDSKDNVLIMWPELSDKPVHPSILGNRIQETAEKCIDEGKNFIVCTFDDAVFNAIRIAIHEKKASGELHSVDGAGNVNCALIDKCGRLNHWFDGVFDTWDNQLDTLLDLDGK